MGRRRRSAQARVSALRAALDGDVVWVSGDPVGPEGRDDIRGLLVEDGCNAVGQILGGHLGYPAVGLAEPVVAIGFATNGTPRSHAFGATNLAQRLPGGRKARADLASHTIGGMKQDEPEVVGGGCCATVPAQEKASSSGCATTSANVRPACTKPIVAPQTPASH